MPDYSMSLMNDKKRVFTQDADNYANVKSLISLDFTPFPLVFDTRQDFALRLISQFLLQFAEYFKDLF